MEKKTKKKKKEEKEKTTSTVRHWSLRKCGRKKRDQNESEQNRNKVRNRHPGKQTFTSFFHILFSREPRGKSDLLSWRRPSDQWGPQSLTSLPGTSPSLVI